MRHTDHFATLERFHELLPVGDDFTLLILKGHLLIEEQIQLLLERRLPKAYALKDARLTFYQKICLAEAVIEECQTDRKDIWLWTALKELNRLRNIIAHNVLATGIEDRMTDFIGLVSYKLGSCNLRHDFESALWSACSEVHTRTGPPDPDLV